MNKFKTRTLLASALLGLAVSAGPAQADLFAIAYLEIDDFFIYGSDGALLDAGAGGDFNTLSFTSSADMDGVLQTSTGAPISSFDFDEPQGDDIDFPSTCLSTTGGCNPLPENTFPLYSGAQGLDYIAADQLQQGAPVLNLERLDGSPFPDLGVTVGQQSIGSLSATTQQGSANVNNGLEASWTFSLAQAQGITLEGNVRTYLEAFASAGELAPGKASAGIEFVITITDLLTGIVVFDASADPGFGLFTDATALNANDFANDATTCGDLAALLGCGNELAAPFSLTTVALLADNEYQLVIRGNTNIDIARVEGPEPSILALLGLGFLGMSLARRRRG